MKINNMKKSIYSKEHKILVDRLINARINSNLNQITIARLLGKSQSYISKIESGQRRIDIVQLKKFSEIYKKPIEFFIK